jgi:hypothetical protein
MKIRMFVVCKCTFFSFTNGAKITVQGFEEDTLDMNTESLSCTVIAEINQ